MILFLCFSTRKEGEEESIFDENGSLKRMNKNSDKTLFKIFLGDGTLISFLRGVPPTKKEIDTNNNCPTNILAKLCTDFYDHCVFKCFGALPFS
jgi:hypothetical protein